MEIQDNVLKEALKNVYFISGTACGGKSTIARELGKKHNILVYDIDQVFSEHRNISSEKNQPSMNQDFADADEYFDRSFDEYKEWLVKNKREQFDFVILDLIRLARHKKVICDCHMSTEQARHLTKPSHIAFLVRSPKNVIDDYCNGEDHTEFKEFIESTSDVSKAKDLCNQVLESINEEKYNDITESEFFWLQRDDTRNIQDTVEIIENHFGWIENPTKTHKLCYDKVKKTITPSKSDLNYEDKKFVTTMNSENGDLDDNTLFHYHQNENVIWATYSGGKILKGNLVGTISPEGELDFYYQHINEANELRKGKCHSVPHILENGKIELHEEWELLSGEKAKGTSIVTER